MDISDIATQSVLEANPDERLGQLRSVFESEQGGRSPTEGPKTVLITDGEECLGVITPQELLQSHMDDDTTAETLMKFVPKLQRDADVRETARLLIENETMAAPVYEGETLWGSVDADEILEAVRENLDVLTVGEIASSDVVDVPEDAELGEAINRLREHGISRLPVVDEEGLLAGVVTTNNIAAFAVRDAEQPSTGDRAGENQQLLTLPVYDLMDQAPETTMPETSVGDAVGQMFETGRDGLVVVPDYAERAVGVLTKTDVLRALSYTEEDHLDVQITNVDLLKRHDREDVRERIEAVSDKYEDLHIIHAHVRFHAHEEGQRGESLVQCKIRLRTDAEDEDVPGTGEGFGADEALHVALEKLERNVLELKGRRSDEAHRGQLLRKLDKL